MTSKYEKIPLLVDGEEINELPADADVTTDPIEISADCMLSIAFYQSLKGGGKFIIEFSHDKEYWVEDEGFLVLSGSAGNAEMTVIEHWIAPFIRILYANNTGTAEDTISMSAFRVYQQVRQFR